MNEVIIFNVGGNPHPIMQSYVNDQAMEGIDGTSSGVTIIPWSANTGISLGGSTGGGTIDMGEY